VSDNERESLEDKGDYWEFEIDSTLPDSVSEDEAEADNYQLRLQEAAGKVEWSCNTGGLGGSAPTVVCGTVIAGGDGNSVYAFDATTGEKQWVFMTNNFVESAPTVANITGSFEQLALLSRHQRVLAFVFS